MVTAERASSSTVHSSRRTMTLRAAFHGSPVAPAVAVSGFAGTAVCVPWARSSMKHAGSACRRRRVAIPPEPLRHTKSNETAMSASGVPTKGNQPSSDDTAGGENLAPATDPVSAADAPSATGGPPSSTPGSAGDTDPAQTPGAMVGEKAGSLAGTSQTQASQPGSSSLESQDASADSDQTNETASVGEVVSVDPAQSEIVDTTTAFVLPKAGPTGTYAANLWPIPILGKYTWTLVVWNREHLRTNDKSIRVLAGAPKRLVKDARTAITGLTDIRLSFTDSHVSQSKTESAPNVDMGDVLETVMRGVVTGNYKLVDAVQGLYERGQVGDAVELVLDESRETVFTGLRTAADLVCVQDEPAFHGESELFDASWLWYRSTGNVLDSEEGESIRVLEIFVAKSTPPDSADLPKHEFFCMNLNPIPILASYTCLVSVTEQTSSTTAHSTLDRRGDDLQLSFVEWVSIESSPFTAGLRRIASVVAIDMQGPVSDQSATIAYTRCIKALKSVGASPRTPDTFRILMDNTPGVAAGSRRCTMLVEVA